MRIGLRAPRVLFSGGGTGGHICPALAVVDALRAVEPATEVLFLGTGREVERRLLEGAGHAYEVAAPHRLDRRLTRLPVVAWQAARGLERALRAVSRFDPDVILGLGGYGQVAGILAGRLLGIPYALFEPNKVPGKANRWLSAGAQEVYIQWPGTEAGLRKPSRARRTGTPVREVALAQASKPEAKAALGLPEDRPALLIVGGSQGAKPLNDWAAACFQKVRRPQMSVIHVTGEREQARALREVYDQAGVSATVLPFAERIGELYAAADLSLCRAGGATLAELTAAGLPAIVVPYPHAADDHQRANAASLGLAARIREQAELGMETFDEIAEILATPPTLAAMSAAASALGRPEAAAEVARSLCALATPTLEAPMKAA